MAISLVSFKQTKNPGKSWERERYVENGRNYTTVYISTQQPLDLKNRGGEGGRKKNIATRVGRGLRWRTRREESKRKGAKEGGGSGRSCEP